MGELHLAEAGRRDAERRADVLSSYGPDGALYVVDFGVIHFSEQGMNAEPNTGLIWKVTRTGR